jgi:hypothetical protein
MVVHFLILTVLISRPCQAQSPNRDRVQVHVDQSAGTISPVWNFFIAPAPVN